MSFARITYRQATNVGRRILFRNQYISPAKDGRISVVSGCVRHARTHSTSHLSTLSLLIPSIYRVMVSKSGDSVLLLGRGNIVDDISTLATTTKMERRFLLIFTLVIVCCSLIDSGEGGRHPQPLLKHHTPLRHDAVVKPVTLAPNRRCPMGHLLDKNGVCRMIW